MEKERKGNDFTRIFSNIRYLNCEARQYEKYFTLKTIIYIFAAVITPISLMFIPTISVYFLTDKKDLLAFTYAVLIIFGIYLVFLITSTYFKTTVNWENTFIRIKQFSLKVYDKCMDCDYSFYETQKARQERQRATSALDSNWSGVELMYKQIPALSIDILGLIVFISSSSFISYKIVLILTGMVICNIALGAFASKIFNKYAKKSASAQGKIDYLYQATKNEFKAKDIRNYNLAKMFNSAINRQYTVYKKYQMIQRVIYILPNLSDSIFGFARDFVAYSILIASVINKTISLTEFTLMLGIVNGLSTYLTQLSAVSDDLMSASKDVTAMRSFLEKRSVFNRGRGIDVSTLHKPFSIEFRSVSFTYADQKKPTLDNVSFKIEPGEKIALVGENGAGKTTIIKLLSGFYKPTSGQILIDGHPLEEFNIHDYYSLLSVINQDINVIGVTIKENIASTVIHSDIDEDKVRKAIKDAGLEEKIFSLPNKEDTYLTQNISDDGIMLSGGETQKLMLARSLYKGGDFLMLDEPTSALDPIAEGEIYKKACVYERKINIKILLANAILLLASYLYVGAKAFYGIITVGSIITLVGAISSLSEAISSAIENIAQMILQVKYISNYFEYMDIKTGDGKGKKIIPSSGKGIISFNHVFFKYPNTDAYALKDVSFTIEPNKKMAIVGRNGAGKSTIIKLIARFYHPCDGQITLDGVNIEEYEFYSYQKLLGILFQDFSLFAFPLKENVSSLPNEITDNNRVEKSLDLVGFDYTDKNKLPRGLDNYIFHDLEDGAELSGGEQQKVAIARALYKDSPIILLDEPTSALDPKSELVVYNSIEKLVNNRTSLFISHRMSSTKFCDSIIVLDKGQIVQTGTHRSLLAQEGIYKKMFNEQAKYYR